MSNILLTSGRGPFPLALARCLHAAGNRVFTADSWWQGMCRFSSAVEEAFQVPTPAHETAAWVKAIAKIVVESRIDLIVPMSEEILYLAQSAEEVGAPIFADDFDTLLRLHNKWLFNQQALEFGLRVPHTQLLTSRDELLRVYSNDGGNLVFKPAYSRYSAHTVVRPDSDFELEQIEPTARRPWVAQRFEPGRLIATFSLARQGRIRAHAAYSSDFSIGNLGPTTAYRPAIHPAAQVWVSQLVERLNFTGQLGIDFIEDAEGRVSAIECNPRATGGLFLLKDSPGFVSAYVDSDFQQMVPPSGRTYVSRLGLFFSLLERGEHFPGVREWTKIFGLGRSTTGLKWSDPLPGLLEPLLTLEYIHRCIKHRIRGEELWTQDYEWSEEPEQQPHAMTGHARQTMTVS